MNWFADLNNHEDVYGLPEDFEFDALWEEVRVGFWLWKMSGFQHMPTREEVRALDPDWVGDMQMGSIIYAYMNNDSTLFYMAEEYLERKAIQNMMGNNDA